MSDAAMTLGVDHVGLSVRDLAATRDFFVKGLGFTLLNERPDYPAAFVTDGYTRITLWQVADPAKAVAFNRRGNVGLHHLAFKVGSSEALNAVFERVSQWPGVVVEFAPELVGKGPKLHCMFAEPSGNRIEIDYDPQ